MDKTSLLVAKGIGAILVALSLGMLLGSLKEILYLVILAIGIFLLALPRKK